MYTVTIRQPDDLAEFRGVARKLLAAGIAPQEVGWTHGQDSLFTQSLPDAEQALTVPRSFADLTHVVICHRDEQSWPLLYEALWRIVRGERSLMDQPADPLAHRLHRMAAEIRRDAHRMTAFVRFRTIADQDGEIFVAWYEPRHRILRHAAGFFIDRFANLRFSILTPDLALHWDRTTAQFAPGVKRENAPSEDATEEWWRCYYASIFNPARLNGRLMRSHMPKHFWRDLPEARDIPNLMAQAGQRTERMIRS